MRRLIPPEPVQRLPADLAGLDSRFAVFGDVVPWRGVVIQPVDALGYPCAEYLVGEDPIHQDIRCCVIRDSVAWGGGAEAESCKN